VPEPTVTYTPRDVTPEVELNTLANVYRFIIDCHAKKGAVPDSRPDDGTKVKEDSANERIIQ
jgi:hypothetical protein